MLRYKLHCGHLPPGAPVTAQKIKCQKFTRVHQNLLYLDLMKNESNISIMTGMWSKRIPNTTRREVSGIPSYQKMYLRLLLRDHTPGSMVCGLVFRAGGRMIKTP